MKDKSLFPAIQHLSALLVAIRNRDNLSKLIHNHLKKEFLFTDLLILLANEEQESLRLFSHTVSNDRHNTPDIATKDFPLKDGFSERFFHVSSPVILSFPEILKGKKFPGYFRPWSTTTISQLIVVPIMSGNTPMSLLILAYEDKTIFPESYLNALNITGHLLHTAVATILANTRYTEIEQERNILLSLTRELAGVQRTADIHKVISEKLNKLIPLHHITTWTPDQFPATDEIIDMVFVANRPVYFHLEELLRRPKSPEYIRLNHQSGMQGVLFVPLTNGRKKTGLLLIYLTTKIQLQPATISLIQGISAQLSAALAILSVSSNSTKEPAPTSNTKDNTTNEESALSVGKELLEKFHDLVGSSPAMKDTYHLITQVAKTQSSVLISGETGTGKELIARAIHNSSPRRRKEMIKVNCAAIQPNLIESELFGHERGSFTGATERRIGKFELANNSTLFLDEVGELPLELQVKLLRALQEREIERVGGRAPIKVDARIIAATNRDLLKDVHAGNFRSDLYFRLNVFPIYVPPLRERREDIPMLAAHFLSRHAKPGVNKIDKLSSNALKQLTAYSWPGNVRELEHQIEKNILLTSGPVMKNIRLPSNNTGAIEEILPGHIRTIDEIEREHIVKVLKACKGKVFGVGGAAEKLKIPGTTLYSKMKRLHIKKHYKN